MSQKITGSQAQPGEKMLEIRIKFWTDQIAETRGEIVPKHALDAGIVYMPRNKSHDIHSTESEKFHTLLELPAAIQRLLIKQSIKLHQGRVTRKYFAQ
jgi:hypothetical protein